MKLLQAEINAVPGNRPNKNLRQEGWVGDGSAFLEIKNETTLVNAYTVRVSCDNPYWSSEWFSITCLPPDAAVENQPPAGKPDLMGPKNQSAKVHINSRGERKLRLDFALPRTSESRAGLYPLTISIESVVTDSSQAGAPPHITELSATLIVRPFFDWSVEYAPVDRRVGLMRRKAQFELIVRNKGNDWLYGDIKIAKANNMMATSFVQRVALPPPEPGREYERKFPLRVATKMRDFRGERVPTNLPYSLVRADAPSIPVIPDEWNQGAPANLGAVVLFQDTKEEQKSEEPPTLTYSPPIPASLAGFGQALLANAKGIFALVLGLFVMYTLFSVAVEKFLLTARPNIDIGQSLPNDGSFSVEGKWVKNAKVEVQTEDSKDFKQVDFKVNPRPLQTAKLSANPVDWFPKDQLNVDLAANGIKDTKITAIHVTRSGLFGYFASTVMDNLPFKKTAKFPVSVGKPPVEKITGATMLTKEVDPDGVLTIKKKDQDFGESEAGHTLDFDPKSMRLLKWGKSEITVKVPKDIAPETPLTVVIDGTELNSKVKKSDQIPAGVPITGPGDVPGGAPGGGAPGGGGPGGGGAGDPLVLPENPGGQGPAGGQSQGGQTQGSRTRPQGGGNQQVASSGPDGYAQLDAALSTDSPRAWSDLASVSDATLEGAALSAIGKAIRGKMDDADYILTGKSGHTPREKLYLDTAKHVTAFMHAYSSGGRDAKAESQLVSLASAERKEKVTPPVAGRVVEYLRKNAGFKG